ncbi:DHH family phosphoesterase [Picrophilus oshimae]|uniref:RecJ-like exonuclease n=1 Tax=Picrophilus torridus (strain ATCC 700027 / DSM 9790 / JCM 10055 / NBRC 100828 / KAW 2/3) TaxID=1122961 RepID=A0A8G2L8L7_PICTO|nr:DHH family phosphoesterase [Picrophilus oshimae]SMD31590.1 RecJ-like exonuclease [Picrophilus oshimae DSM 9789]
MINDIINNDFYSLLKKGSEKIRENDYVRILAHYDGDGVSSAIILTNALKREGIKFHLSYVSSLDEKGFRQLYEEEKDVFTIMVDAGSDQAQFISDYNNYVILDHHFHRDFKAPGININARDFGYNGTTEACGATMAFLMALTMNEDNKDLLPFFVSGVMADKQDIGGFKGLNASIYNEYNKNKTFHMINIDGSNIHEAITYSTDPFFYNLTGYPDNVNEMLSSLNIDPEKHVYDLDNAEMLRLGKALSLRLLSQNIGIDGIKYLETDVIMFDEIKMSSKLLSDIIDGNSRIGANSIPVQYFLGDKSVENEMNSNRRIFKTKLIDYIYRSKNNIKENDYLRYFYAPESEMAGPITGTMALYLFDVKKPIIGFNAGTENIKVSSRGTRHLVSRGLNLSVVMREASQRVGGSGGGHDIAAGAVIPLDTEKKFIDYCSEIIKSQLGSI